MIQLQHVSKVFDGNHLAVDDVSFSVKEGEIFGLIGTSGCGKTTTMKMINRLIDPTSGSIFVDDQQVKAQKPESLRQKIGYVIQDVGLFPHYTVAENIATVPTLKGWNKKRIESRCEDLLELVGLNADEFAHRKPEALSGGQQQRVGLARALAADPPIILMDEPFGALDPITKREVQIEVQNIFSEINKTVLLVTHDVVEAFAMCDRLCLLDAGKVQQIGTPQELLFSPANDFVDSFFASDRFQLELLSVNLSEILDIEPNSKLYWSPPLEGEQEDEIGREQSLYSIIEEMEERAHDNTVIIHRVDGQTVDSLSFSNLLSKFRQYSNTLKAGGANG
ncbi:osmoprotectant transport system ATP-binding protein [Fodinibius salinus]|uniref:Osmoprotectant transport system ATP-binding protein n=1 Tax=Fodinibius salinus TaxID=860790 RepID=A0A5D3YL27_9BACT|nr:ATP-binding cassette domain-containing protein [Fodinibius salinus]TYP93357.1 osmoprotectant transport system ATP-binding protein [Fodinibius salinus]